MRLSFWSRLLHTSRPGFGRVLAALLLTLALLPALSSCDSKPGGQQSVVDKIMGNAPVPVVVIDSATVEHYMTSHPQFKDHLADAKQFYREREGRLAWFDKNGEVVPQAQKMLDKVAQAGQEGLDAKRYRVVDFKQRFAALKAARSDTAKLAKELEQTDLALSATYFDYFGDFYRGTIDPRAEKKIDWTVKRNKIKLYRALQTILKERESTYPYYEFESLHPEYDALRDALAKMRAVQKQGGWGTVPTVEKLEPGQSDPAVVPALRKRLLPGATGSAEYDPALAQAVRTFQDHHGLKPDGIVGGETLKDLNVSVDDRIDQIIINMERWRWIPKKFGDRYLLVNIPEYKFHLVDKGKEVFDMRVIVGKKLNSTPIFSDKMEYIVIAPYWNVPMSIVVKEIKGNMLRNPGFLASQNMEIVTRDKAHTVIDAGSIDWANVSETNFKYLIRQKPGPENSLGSIKFIFPNEDDIYLHDTPHDALFNQTQRGFSHGCVRVEYPTKLAEYLLRDQPEWTEEKIRETINGGEEKWVTLKEKLPVYIVYLTAWVDKDGNLNFRDDIYGHDRTLEKEYFGA